jgi:hypothetical protein
MLKECLILPQTHADQGGPFFIQATCPAKTSHRWREGKMLNKFSSLVGVGF